MNRIDSLIVQPIVTNYTEDGKPVSETLGQPSKIFRIAYPDVWAALDQALEAHQAAQHPTHEELVPAS